jgi:hypothetical protein
MRLLEDVNRSVAHSDSNGCPKKHQRNVRLHIWTAGACYLAQQIRKKETSAKSMQIAPKINTVDQ